MKKLIKWFQDHANRYTVFGGLIGLAFVLLNFLLFKSSLSEKVTFNLLWQEIKQRPIHIIILLSPVILSSVMRLLGKPVAKALQQANAIIRENQTLRTENTDFDQLEKVISRGKKEWETIFDTVQNSILVVKQDGTVSRANLAAVRWLGTTFQGVINKPIEELLFGDFSSNRNM